MKQTFTTLSLLLIACMVSYAQPEEAELLFHWQDDNLPVNSWLSSRYNEVWGFVQNGREYAVIGSTNGTHIFDVTDPTNAYEAAFVAGKDQGSSIIHRDYHDYNGYLYAVADEGSSSLQIIDLSNLPNSVNVVYDSDQLILRAHNIFIDSASAKLYALGTTTSFALFSVCVYDLSNPADPIPLGCYPNANASIPYVHDAFVRNDTAWLNCGSYGLYLVDFSSPASPVILGTMDGYPQEGYNHSGWMHETLPYYYMADETLGSDLKVVDVSDPMDMHVVSTFNSEPSDGGLVIPHNLIVRDNSLYVSYYFEGLQVYDISDPINPQRVLYYDTYPDDVNVNQVFFQGAWGVYPFLPSGNILISDLNNGLFITNGIEPVTTSYQQNQVPELRINIFPNPTTEVCSIFFQATTDAQTATAKLYRLDGQLVQPFGKWKLIQGQFEGTLRLSPNVSPGLYFLEVRLDNGLSFRKKIMVQQ